MNNKLNGTAFVFLIVIGVICIEYGLWSTWFQNNTSIIVIDMKPLNGTSHIASSVHDDYWKLYCLSTTEACFPTTKCNRLRDIQNAKREKISICMDQLIKNRNCLVYSVGISGSYEFDIQMGRYGCDVHSFDPTVDYPQNLAPNVTFHKWGLRGSNANGAATHFQSHAYGNISGEMMTLSQIMNRLGHTKIDILRIDCEGCEWEVFAEPKTQKILCNITQILAEFHYGKNFLPSTDNLTMVSKMYDFLNYCNFKQFKMKVNLGFPWDQHINQEFIVKSHMNITNKRFPQKKRVACCREYGFLKNEI